MAGNPYAVDFSPISQGIDTFKKKQYDKRLKSEVDSLIKKRDNLDTDLSGAATKQQQLIDDTPEMDQSLNQQQLGGLQEQRAKFKSDKYGELGGLTPKDLQGMSTDAVAKYKDYLTVERAAETKRKTDDTTSAFIRFEALGQDPNALLSWFNKYEAHKWGLPDGAGEFKETTQTHPDTGEPYIAIEVRDAQGNTIQTMPKDKFMQYATSSIDPTTTQEMAKSLKKGVHGQVVRATALKKAADLLEGDLPAAMKKIGMTNAEYQQMQGFPVIADVLGEYFNVDIDGDIQGRKRGLKGGREVTQKAAKKQVVAKAGAGSGANKRVELLLKVREANAKQDKQSAEALYREITSQYGNEDMIAIDKSGNIIPNTKLMKQELDTDIEEYTLLVEQNDDPADKEYLIQLQSWKNAIKEAKARGLRTADTNDNIMDVVLQYIDASSGGDVTGLKGDRQASPSGMGQPIEARGTSKSRGSTKKTAEGKVVPALEPSVSMPQAMGMQTSPPAVLRPDARAKRTQGKLSPEAKAARIKELNKKLKGLI